MSVRSTIHQLYFQHVKRRATSPAARQAVAWAKELELRAQSIKYVMADAFPSLLRPNLTAVKLALTSNCNLRCRGCTYGRTFLPGEALDRATIERAFDDFAELDIARVHLHGGEPMLHPEIGSLVSMACTRGICPSLGTNGIALSEPKVEALYKNGLRSINVGIYGVTERYDWYVDRQGSYDRLVTNLLAVRERFSDIDLTLAWLLMRPTCSRQGVEEISRLAEQLKVSFGVVLVQYGLPYFVEGEERELQLFETDRQLLEEVAEQLLRLKHAQPDRISTSAAAIAAIPDWVILKEQNDVPCYLEDTVFILPNGDVFVCPNHPRLGNLREMRFKDIVHNAKHAQAVRDCMQLNCTRCHFRWDMRTELHGETRRRYRTVGASRALA